MQRCIQLAKLGAAYVAPNPMVGAVLVYEDEIIGEGYHQQYGKAHAEVNCINSVTENNSWKICLSTLYVSLEPCNHFGKTPPCSHLIVERKIKKVVIGCRDPFALVNGKGIEFLQQNHIEVVTDVLVEECKGLNKRFFIFHTTQKPYVILKFAQTNNGMIGNFTDERLFISNEITNQQSHQWRSEEAAILIGTNTALKDNPTLTNRNNVGKQPVRLLIDKHLKVPKCFNVFNTQAKTVVFNLIKNDEQQHISYVQINEDAIAEQILKFCYENNLLSLIVEGGTTTLQYFINEHLWNELRVITNKTLVVNAGIKAPLFSGNLIKEEKILNDTIQYYIPKND